MTASRLPQFGSIIWAELADANGIRKTRPAVVVTATDEIVPGGIVRVAAISTRLPVPLPADYVMLPWSRQGTAHSGLRRKSAAVGSWVAELAVDDVQQVVGIVSPTVMRELMGKLAASSGLSGSGDQSNLSPPATPTDEASS